MAQIKIENLSFGYSLCESDCLDGINLTINSGEYVVLCGKSGCGKTSLLRHIKPSLAPKGRKNGKIFIDGIETDKLSFRDQSEKIGFVMQDPDSQIVTDKVWHELAFGLENLGLKTAEIRMRVAEMAAYFGIDDWFGKKTDELSGGQKQMLNLACAMAMHPDILVLDEPTSQLDPIAADRFLATISRINRDLGVTVIISEHRLEEIFHCADRIVILENGKIIADDIPQKIGATAHELPQYVRLCLPTAMRIFSAVNGDGNSPVSVRDGRKWLGTQKIYTDKLKKDRPHLNEETAIKLKNISFRYEKNGADILSSLDIEIPENSIFALLGGNGAGKTTLTKVILGIEKPYTGKLKVNGSITVLPQDVLSLFALRTVRAELEEMTSENEKIREVSVLTGISPLLDSHPYDISGGEQQRLGVAKILLCDRDIYFFDEPTKGMDAEFKITFAKIIERLKMQGKTVVLVSHDIEFCAEHAEMCAMLFDGKISAVLPADDFFDGNRFYTTAANKISKGFITGAVTDKDVIKCLKK